MSTAEKLRYSPEQYLALERAAPYRSEYYQGEIFSMAGASGNHNRIVLNLARSLGNQLAGRKCEAFVNDMRVEIPGRTGYTYPDAVIVCGEGKFIDHSQDTLLNPRVIIEVLSNSTEAYDRGLKFEQYQSIPSLQEYLLINQTKPHLDHFVRVQGSQWNFTSSSGLEAVVELPAIECRLALTDLYERVVFPEPSAIPPPTSMQ